MEIQITDIFINVKNMMIEQKRAWCIRYDRQHAPNIRI